MKFICSFELSDDQLAKLVFKHYTGKTFPVMLTFYNDGKYTFEGYEPDQSPVITLPSAE